MIFKRFAANLRAQNWFAIGIELGIVILGVFIGTLVANWNSARAEQKEIARLIEQMRPEVRRLTWLANGARDYYAVTDQYAKTAARGWEQPGSVNDRDFVIAAYQASQIVVVGAEANNFPELIGGDQVRKINDTNRRNAIMRLLNYNFYPVSLEAMRTRYRDEIRSIIPSDIQATIRDKCGDRMVRGGGVALPERCDVILPGAEVARTAAILRQRSTLPEDLRLHQAYVATFLFNLSRLEARLQEVERVTR